MENNNLNCFSDESQYDNRHHPSRKSVKEYYDGRPIILYVTAVTYKRMCVLANDDAHESLKKAWNEADNWLVGRYNIMPDHTHFFCAPGRWPCPSFHNWMRYWKSLSAKHFWQTPTGQKALPYMKEENDRNARLWQRDCWDRQLRNGESYEEKWNYVRNNPVRANLVKKAEDWPYQGEMHKLRWWDK